MTVQIRTLADVTIGSEFVVKGSELEVPGRIWVKLKERGLAEQIGVSNSEAAETSTGVDNGRKPYVPSIGTSDAESGRKGGLTKA
jgi:hypothetical protein